MFNKNLVLGAVLVFCSLHLGTASAILIEAIPEDEIVEINVGESLTVDVWISGLGNSMAPSLSVYDIDLLFNSSLFNSGLVTFGDQLAVSIGFVSPLPGLVNVSETSFVLPVDLINSQPDSFRLFSVNFVATNPGVGVFDLFVWALGDEFGAPLDFATNARTVLVTRPSAVPVPAALWLFGSGLIGLVAAAKRRKIA